MAIDPNIARNGVAHPAGPSSPWYQTHIPLQGFCSARLESSTNEDGTVKVEVELNASFLSDEEADQLVKAWPRAVQQLLLGRKLQPGQSGLEMSLTWGGLVPLEEDYDDDDDDD